MKALSKPPLGQLLHREFLSTLEDMGPLLDDLDPLAEVHRRLLHKRLREVQQALGLPAGDFYDLSGLLDIFRREDVPDPETACRLYREEMDALFPRIRQREEP